MGETRDQHRETIARLAQGDFADHEVLSFQRSEMVRAWCCGQQARNGQPRKGWGKRPGPRVFWQRQIRGGAYFAQSSTQAGDIRDGVVMGILGRIFGRRKVI